MRPPQRLRPPSARSLAELRKLAAGMYAPVTLSKSKKKPANAGRGGLEVEKRSDEANEYSKGDDAAS